jgi:DNA-binding transcriptional MocR family regulator
MQFAQRLDAIETSAIRELFKLLGKPGIISFAGGFPDPALFDVDGIREASQAVLANSPGPVLQYGATEGYGPLREGISAFMAAKGGVGSAANAQVAAEGLIVTTGSQQALDLIGKTLISPGDTVIVEAPTFLATIQCFRLYGAHIIGAPIDADGVDVDRLEQLIVQHKPKLVYLIPTFGNPSGATLSLARRLRILEIAVRTGTVVVEDDPYGELYFDQPPPPSLLALSPQVPGSGDWLAHCGSFSKILSPGLRVGWLIAPPELLARATMCKQFSDAHTSNLSQAICAHYLTLNRLDATLDAVRPVYAARARVMADSLRREMGDAIEFNQPQGGLFFWARLTGAGGRNADAAAFAQKAIERLVAFVPGNPFFAHDPDTASLRLSFATVGEAKIVEGVARLGQALLA